MTQKVVLVVEHDAALRGRIASILREEGYLVLTVAESAMAIEVAQHNPLSLVLLDPLFLQPSGLEICRQVRASPQTAHMPILMMVTDESEITQMVGR